MLNEYIQNQPSSYWSYLDFKRYTIHYISSLANNTCEYLLLVQHEMGEAPSTQGLDMFWMLLKNGTEVKYGSLALTQ